MTRLQRIEASLPSGWYFDPDHYRRELEAIWYRDWVCVGRLDEIPRPGDYFVAPIGTQRIVVTQGADGRPRAFHNTCRHRGSVLCVETAGHFRNGRIVCPYHTWTYSLDGDLLATPYRIESDGFDRRDFPLYRVSAETWGGFIFVNLAEAPRQSFDAFLGSEAAGLSGWPLAELRSVQQDRNTLACNWKVFWENYNECYHCPRVHPELCRIVPAYRKGVVDDNQLADRDPVADSAGDRARVAPGVETWTTDGRSGLPPLPGLTDDERRDSMRFASFPGSLFVVAHADYARSVRVVPLGPESIELVVDWYLPPAVASAHADRIPHLLELGRLVVAQDGRVCELNQQGLHSRAHRQGVLVGQENGLWDFHEWLRQRLAALDADLPSG